MSQSLPNTLPITVFDTAITEVPPCRVCGGNCTERLLLLTRPGTLVTYQRFTDILNVFANCGK